MTTMSCRRIQRIIVRKSSKKKGMSRTKTLWLRINVMIRISSLK